MPEPPSLRRIVVPGDPAAWARLGFELEAREVRLGTVALAVSSAAGEATWALAGEQGPTDLDGVPTRWDPGPLPSAPPPGHPNGAYAVDHVVVTTDDLERTSAALAAVGSPLRRTAERDGRRQGFHWLGEVICELVEAGEGPARIWGLTLVAERPEAFGRVRDAVQPGRRIATVPRDAGLGMAVAVMTPHVRA